MTNDNPRPHEAESANPADPTNEAGGAPAERIEAGGSGASSPRSEAPGVSSASPSESPSDPEHRVAAPAPLLFSQAQSPRPEPEPWRGRDLLFFVGFCVIWAVLSGFLVLAGYAILRPLMGWKASASDLVDNTFFGLVVQIVLYGPVLLYIILLVVAHYRLAFWAGIHWRWPGSARASRLLLGGMLLAFLVFAGSAIVPDRRDFPLEKMFSSPSAAYALGAFAVFVAPFMEELIFRGVLFAFFQRLAGLRWAVVATALLFAALHYPEYAGAWTHMGMILIVGVVFSLARAMTGSVAPSFLLHTGYNGTLMLALFVGTHHFKNLQALSGGG